MPLSCSPGYALNPDGSMCVLKTTVCAAGEVLTTSPAGTVAESCDVVVGLTLKPAPLSALVAAITESPLTEGT